ncbi:MAG: hypothetical protein FWD23_19280, partial [Oscillospiraceae bacterium]|nr:hypothetical protein [Oscillospiraceae bacterium]
MKKLKTLAKKSVNADKKVVDMKIKLDDTQNELAETKTQLATEIKKRPSITDHLNWFEKFMAAMKRAPKRLMAVIADIMRQPPEKVEPERSQPERSKNQSRTEAR